ncbi:hypothetical protein CRE_21543 [Caenorhabditis remanei]|uniref:Uncharacterized protein n=1 Tax=Caenorhabditis remanei TaxID=31234 RepID=E3NCP1_CAERE|nr:hypothetical protein CRE_21543 [Caenorhabditis remanei]
MSEEWKELILNHVNNTNNSNQIIPEINNEDLFKNFMKEIKLEPVDDDSSSKLSEYSEVMKIPKDIKTELETKEYPVFDMLNEGILNENTITQEKLNNLLNFMNSFTAMSPSDNNSNETVNNEMDMTDADDEWQAEFKKLDRETHCKLDKKQEERHRQMAKNREYARKCVQKKKDLRKQAEMQSMHILRRIQLQQKFNSIKERNGNFAVFLRIMEGDTEAVEQKKVYEGKKLEMNKKYDEMFSADEAVNLNFHRLASSREEFEKAATDLQMKNGVIGTLGSRKIRAKQQMEWRQHLYNISVHEHKLRREIELSKLADEYVRVTVPAAAPLIQSMPKHLLDEIIKNNRTSELEEFYRFVGDNSNIIDDSCNSDVKEEKEETVVK